MSLLSYCRRIRANPAMDREMTSAVAQNKAEDNSVRVLPMKEKSVGV